MSPHEQRDPPDQDPSSPAMNRHSRAVLNVMLSGRFGTREVAIQELGLASCVMTHIDRLGIGISADLRFSWGDHGVSLRSLVIRSTIDSVDACVVRYRSEVSFRTADASEVEKLRAIMMLMPV